MRESSRQTRLDAPRERVVTYLESALAREVERYAAKEHVSVSAAIGRLVRAGLEKKAA